MDSSLNHCATQFALEQLMKTHVGEKFQHTLQLIQSMQEHLTAMSEKKEVPSVTGTKTVTVLALAVLKKIARGQSPSSFDTEDWKEIGNAVSEYAILLDGERYSIFVFHLYEKYIRAAAEMIARLTSPEPVEAIMSLADELHSNEMLCRNGQISEVAYTQDCLWISLEAMIKLIASAASMFCGQQAAEFAQALASCAFEYGRLMLYRKEQALVTQFIESQYRLDEELEKQHAEYLSELEAQSTQFYALIDHAFDPDFRTAFLHSFLLVEIAGVKESEILLSAEDIDSFFLD
ncbi:MAG: hypothetical protein ACOX85_10365 [Candidatus Pararuminococcus gallinarum]|jgi:hypothetical protein